MQRQPGETSYDSLRNEHAKADHDPEPLRPEKVYSPTNGWTSDGGMAQQQASANSYNKEAQARLASQVNTESLIDTARGSEPLSPDLQKGIRASESPEVAKASVYVDMDPAGRLANERADRMQGVNAADRQIGAARSHQDVDPKLSALTEKNEVAEKRGESALQPEREPSRYKELDEASRSANEKADRLAATQTVSSPEESRGQSV